MNVDIEETNIYAPFDNIYIYKIYKKIEEEYDTPII